MSKSNIRTIRPAATDSLADLVCVTQSEIQQALSIIRIVVHRIGTETTAQVDCKSALATAEDLLDRCWDRLHGCEDAARDIKAS